MSERKEFQEEIHTSVDLQRLKELTANHPHLLATLALISPRPIVSDLPTFIRECERQSYPQRVALDASLQQSEVAQTLEPLFTELGEFRERFLETSISDDPYVIQARDVLKTARGLLSRSRKSVSRNEGNRKLAQARARNEIAEIYGADIFGRISDGRLYDVYDESAARDLHKKEIKYEIFAEDLETPQQDALFESIAQMFGNVQTRLFADSLLSHVRNPIRRPVVIGGMNDVPLGYVEDLDEQTLLGLTFVADLNTRGNNVDIYVIDESKQKVLIGSSSKNVVMQVENMKDLANASTMIEPDTKIVTEGEMTQDVVMKLRWQTSLLLTRAWNSFLHGDFTKVEEALHLLQDSSLRSQLGSTFPLSSSSFRDMYNWYVAKKGEEHISQREEEAKRRGLRSIFEGFPMIPPPEEVVMRRRSPQLGTSSRPTQLQIRQSIRDIDPRSIRNTSKSEYEERKSEQAYEIENNAGGLDALYFPTSRMTEAGMFVYHTLKDPLPSDVLVHSKNAYRVHNGLVYFPFHPLFDISQVDLRTVNGDRIPQNAYFLEKDIYTGALRVHFMRTFELCTFTYSLQKNDKENIEPPTALKTFNTSQAELVQMKLHDAGLTQLAKAFNLLMNQDEIELLDIENILKEQAIYSFNPKRVRSETTDTDTDGLGVFKGFVNPRSGKLNIQCDTAALLYSKILNLCFDAETPFHAEPLSCYQIPSSDQKVTLNTQNSHARVGIFENGKLVSIRDTTPQFTHLPTENTPAAVLHLVSDADSKEAAQNEIIARLTGGLIQLGGTRDVEKFIRYWLRQDITEPLASLSAILIGLRAIRDIDIDSFESIEIPRTLQRFAGSKRMTRKQFLFYLQERTVSTQETLRGLIQNEVTSDYASNLSPQTISYTRYLLQETSNCLTYLMAL